MRFDFWKVLAVAAVVALIVISVGVIRLCYILDTGVIHIFGNVNSDVDFRGWTDLDVNVKSMPYLDAEIKTNPRYPFDVNANIPRTISTYVDFAPTAELDTEVSFGYLEELKVEVVR